MRVPELASVRSWLPGRFLEGFWLQNGAILASKMVFFCYVCLPFWLLFLAWIFGRFSLHLSSEFWLFWVWREKGAEGFRLVKTNGFSRFFNVREAAGRAARQATEHQKQHKIPPPKIRKIYENVDFFVRFATYEHRPPKGGPK